MTSFTHKITAAQRGGALVEYGILVGLVAVTSIGSIVALGDGVSSVFGDATGTLASSVASSVEAATSASASAESDPIVPLIANPSDFTFTFVHGDNTRSFFLLYDFPVTGSDCAVQLTTPDGQSLAADTGLACDSLSQNLTLPEATLPNGWGGTTARLVRSGGGEVIADIGALACTEMSNSTTSTPTLDENCDGVFEGGIIGNSEVDRYASHVLIDGSGPVHIAAGEENARLICEDFDEALVSFTTRAQAFNGFSTRILFDYASAPFENYQLPFSGTTRAVLDDVTCNEIVAWD